MLLKQGNEILVLLKTKTTKLGLFFFFFFNMYNIIGCEKPEGFIARQNLECHLPGSFRKAHLVQHDNGSSSNASFVLQSTSAPGTCLSPTSPFSCQQSSAHWARPNKSNTEQSDSLGLETTPTSFLKQDKGWHSVVTFN